MNFKLKWGRAEEGIALITSRWSKLFHRESGSNDRVTSSSDICSGDLKDDSYSSSVCSSSLGLTEEWDSRISQINAGKRPWKECWREGSYICHQLQSLASRPMMAHNQQVEASVGHVNIGSCLTRDKHQDHPHDLWQGSCQSVTGRDW